MAAAPVGESLTGYDEDSMNDGGSGGDNRNQPAVDYDIASRVTPSVHLKELSIHHLQALVISTVGSQHEAEIRQITDKDHLLRLLTYLQKPQESNDGQLPRPDVFEIPFQDLDCKFTEAEIAGSGGFSRVYRGMIYFTPCAIKVTRSVDPRVLQKLIPTLRKEIEIMRNSHPNVCSLLGVCRNGNQLYICMELMSGNLEKYLKVHADLSPMKRIGIVSQIARGLNWLHNLKPSILHLDLKLENVLHDENGVMKLTDFGLSAILSQDANYVESKSRSPGNVGHMSPEVIQNEPFNQGADVYGFAILIWEILKGYEWETEVVGQLEEMGLETKNANLRQLVKTAVCQRNLRPKVDRCPWPASLKNLLKQMWDGTPANRPPLRNLLDTELQLISYEFSIDYVRNRMIDEVGQEFWLQNYPKNLEEPVPWNDFKQKFYNFMRLPLPRNEEDRFDTDTKRLLFFKIALNATREEMVTFESFAKVCDAFGRVKPNSYDFFDTIQVTVCNRWFRPELSQNEAKNFLHGQEDGTFIVRFSSRVGVPFTLTRVLDGKIHQTRFFRFPDGFRVGEENSRWRELKFNSLLDIMSNSHIIEAFKLKNYPVLRALGPGEKLMLAPLIDTNYADAMNGSEMLDELMALSMQNSGKPGSSSASSSSSQHHPHPNYPQQYGFHQNRGPF
mmetsp:Transcript_14802/g.23133  ORF Transcript_14802/g.23133 Transcript_14802/m.23133 type:complete len:673 (-) Transcript_14802:397-2415(-)|eukprot:CAMPEP_0201541148 /NCGR_PEP_ID=MMETSP0161_2-20130828/71319_1 /ASSEMBLY_ACC=CAM_ASM_000251 /TAXON_ID=180227 /ORGANISM="Neoparamoeba aestuarina, Strain SoJaBio B1-5/56/2" /LENGTH=672 /DNA_ID=CAMNT_0047948663 /DNA_START=86 /DNA_END=2104 /DNA_ORIENTATION=+